MKSAIYDLEINQGEVFTQAFAFKDPQTKQPINLTGYTARSQVRKTPLAASPLVTFGIAIDGVNGLVTISASVADLASLPFDTEGAPVTSVISAVWDLFLVDSGGNPQRYLKGQALLYPEVSR